MENKDVDLINDVDKRLRITNKNKYVDLTKYVGKRLRITNKEDKLDEVFIKVSEAKEKQGDITFYGLGFRYSSLPYDDGNYLYMDTWHIVIIPDIEKYEIEEISKKQFQEFYDDALECAVESFDRYNNDEEEID